ncbi:MAG: SH3 domain-containing protein [Anaerolineales bacterium]|nr:SH3 domain-containing protein [Anaerolineales bacterium]
MREKIFFRVVTILLILAITTACNLVPSHFEIETTSELGPDTLSRIDDINEMLDRGVEIGPETRAMIEELNDTIAEGLEFGFKQNTLDRVDALLGIIEEGVGIKLGLDPETNATVNSLIDTIEDMPGQWEDTMTEIIQVLETSTSNVASDIADEVSALMEDARVNSQQVVATVGIEFRCNVDFLGARAGETVDEFIGRTLVGQLREIISGESPDDDVPVPWVCQIIPDQVNLEEVGEVIVFTDAVIKISGYNYEQANLPTAYIVDEAGNQVETAALYPFLTSPYQIQLNLQGIDFSTVPERSRVVFHWPGAEITNALSVVFPGQEIIPTAVPVAMLTINTPAVDVLKGPGTNYHVIGGAENGAQYEVLGQNGDGSWFQIDYDGTEAWVPASSVTRNAIPVPVVSIPGPLPEASFVMLPETGDAPLEVSFVDTSSGDPLRWTWNFGEGLPVFTKDADHAFETAGTYSVSLKVENDLGFSLASREVVVDQPLVYIPLSPLILEMAPMFLIATPDFPPNSVVFTTFAGLNPPVHLNTGISSEQHECGIVGMAALHGDIEEGGFGNIIYANLLPEGNTWYLNADFKTHKNSETWYFSVMCMRKADADGYNIYRRVRVEPNGSDTVSLSGLGIPDNRLCGVVGIGAWNGNINEDGQGQHIIKAFTSKNSDGEWELTANFNTHGDHAEVWDVDVLCVHNDPNVFRLVRLEMIRGGVSRDTGMNASQWACGIVGMEALYGDINENDTGDILEAYPYIKNNNWHVYTNFRTHGDEEFWDIDLLCVNRNSARINSNYAEGWVP